MEAKNFDVVVIGGGIAGLTAANRAAEEGLRVALLERGSEERYLCNSRYSGGIIHIAFRNMKDPPDSLVEAIQAATVGKADPALARALATTAGRAAARYSRRRVYVSSAREPASNPSASRSRSTATTRRCRRSASINPIRGARSTRSRRRR